MIRRTRTRTFSLCAVAVARLAFVGVTLSFTGSVNAQTNGLSGNSSSSCIDINRVREMARISQIAYEEKTNAANQMKGYDLVQVWTRSDFEGSALGGLIRISNIDLPLSLDPELILGRKREAGKTIFTIAFRGSEGLLSWDALTDINFTKGLCALSNSSSSDNVHCGYRNYANLGWAATKDVVVPYLKRSDSNVEIIITGHSLGGAAATLYAAMLREAGVSPQRISVYTYAAPAVGNEEFARQFDSFINVFRVRNSPDVVPFLGLPLLHHVGNEIVLRDITKRPPVISGAKGNTILKCIKEDMTTPTAGCLSLMAAKATFSYLGRNHSIAEHIRLLELDSVIENALRGVLPRCPSGVVGTAATAGGLATALVIDRSGSMKGEKLRKAKAGAGAYVKLLEPDDYASVTFFSDTASTELPMTPQTKARELIDAILGNIASAGATNMEAGLRQGFQQLQALGDAAQNVGLLLSDGMNNRGDWSATVGDYKSKGWPIYTIAYGGDADEKTLEHIADITGGRHWPSGTTIGVHVYCQINNDVNNRSGSLAVSDNLAPGGAVVHLVHVAPGAQTLTGCISWQGSKLETVLVSPTGLTIRKDQLTGRRGRYDEGKTYQVFKVYNPQPGRWQVRIRWIEPPAAAEQINISLSEKSDAFGQILGFKPEYQPGEPVRINVEVAEVIGYKRVPLLDARVRVQVQKPGGPKMARLVRTRPVDLRSAKRAVQSATRNIRLYDDGAHADYRADDGIFGGSFTETDENGAYLVTATVTGHKRSGQRVQRRLIASFQVGPISQNPVTTAQILEVRDLLEDRTDPAETIEALQGDPLDAINKLRQGVQ